MCDFARERVGVDRRRAPRPDRERVQSRGPASAPAARRGGPLVRDVVELLRLAVAGAVDHEIPERDLARGGQTRADLHHRRRPERVVEELLGAVPDHLHGPARRLGQPRRFDGLRRDALFPPKPPPTYGVTTRTFCGAKPSACATCCFTGNGVCVPAHTVALPPSIAAVAECGLHRRVRHVAVEIGLLDDRRREFLALPRGCRSHARCCAGGAVLTR